MAPEDAPATKRDIRELEERLTTTMDGRLTGMDGRLTGMDGRLTGMDGRLTGMDERMTGMEERLLERMRDMQTELLKAFLPYQEQTRLRDSALEARQSAL